MTTRYITLGYWHVTSAAVRDSILFSIEKMSTFKAIKFHLKQSYDKQNLTLMVISYEIYETHLRLISLISYKMTTYVRSSISYTEFVD